MRSTHAPLVSVIISSFNYDRFLNHAIDSALAQAYPATEVIVVDDGSTDSSRDVIARYGRRILPVLKNNGGMASVFNAGFAASRGEVVIFLDADDGLLPTAAQRAAEFLCAGMAKVHWPLLEIDEQGRTTGRRIPTYPLPEGDFRDQVIREGPDGCLGPPTTGNAWSRDFLRHVLPMPEPEFRQHADSYLVTLAPLFGRIGRIVEPQALYRIHGANDYACKSTDEKNRRNLAIYHRRCAVLSEHLHRQGIDRPPETWKENNQHYRWMQQLERAMRDVAAFVPAGDTFILVDDGRCRDGWGGSALIDHRRALPFLERAGEYWGRPADDETAIREVERMRDEGARFLVVVWPAFWWRTQYAAWNAFLRTTFRCVLENDAVVIFDLEGRPEESRVPLATESQAIRSARVDAEARTVVCVLGMHRSGTSLAMRLVSLLGVDIGAEEHLVPSAGDNPKGFWEDRAIVRLNELLLRRLRGRSMRPPKLEAGWEYDPRLDDLRARARRLVSGHFGTARLWGWKDPRTSLTLPFWRTVVAPTHYVLCLRDPRDVVRSVERRDGLSPARALQLWLVYTGSALSATRGENRVCLVYERVIEDCITELTRLASFLGAAADADTAVCEAAMRLVDPSLQHHRTAGAPAPDITGDRMAAANQLAYRAYEEIALRGAPRDSEAARLIGDALALVAPVVHDEEVSASALWRARRLQGLDEITAAIPVGAQFVLVDNNQWVTGDDIAGRRRIPFPERDGQYCGRPADAKAAIQELERLRGAGASFVVIAWPAFWWLDHYTEFDHHLRSRFSCCLENDRVIVFDARR